MRKQRKQPCIQKLTELKSSLLLQAGAAAAAAAAAASCKLHQSLSLQGRQLLCWCHRPVQSVFTWAEGQAAVQPHVALQRVAGVELVLARDWGVWRVAGNEAKPVLGTRS